MQILSHVDGHSVRLLQEESVGRNNSTSARRRKQRKRMQPSFSEEIRTRDHSIRALDD
jgi:hypothetical protein